MERALSYTSDNNKIDKFFVDLLFANLLKYQNGRTCIFPQEAPSLWILYPSESLSQCLNSHPG